MNAAQELAQYDPETVIGVRDIIRSFLLRMPAEATVAEVLNVIDLVSASFESQSLKASQIQ